MKMTRYPTDKKGNIYYGPKTVDQAEAAIRDMDADPAQVVSHLRGAGYARVAAIIAKRYPLGCGRAQSGR